VEENIENVKGPELLLDCVECSRRDDSGIDPVVRSEHGAIVGNHVLDHGIEVPPYATGVGNVVSAMLVETVGDKLESPAPLWAKATVIANRGTSRL
jgi:hypothetical protein